MPDVGVAAFPDVEGGAKTWLRGIDEINAFVEKRVFMGVPRKDARFPAIAIHRVGGGPVDGDYPADQGRIQFDVWGTTGGKIRCWALTQILVRLLLNVHCGTVWGGTVRVMGVYSVQVNYLPESSTGQARYVVGCTIMAQAV